MFGLREPFDPASLLVILLTFVLFSVALFVKGLTHEILLEAGMFLVSVKLIMMSSRITNISEDIVQKLSVICAAPGSDDSQSTTRATQYAIHALLQHLEQEKSDTLHR